MPTNLEFKAHYPSIEQGSLIASRFIKREPELLLQVDTYFNVREGRLKLREKDLDEAELIYYLRNDVKSDKFSDYSIVPVHDVDGLKQLLARLWGVKVVVNKKRLLYLYENARIHLDAVEGLGTFIEFEVLMTRGKSQASRLMRRLREMFGIADDAVVAGSYSDLILGKPDEE